jgi:hypothetical protein
MQFSDAHSLRWDYSVFSRIVHVENNCNFSYIFGLTKEFQEYFRKSIVLYYEPFFLKLVFMYYERGKIFPKEGQITQ